MSDQKSAKDVIENFQKKQQRAPRSFVFGALALILIFAGGVVLFQWYNNPDAPMFAFLAGTSTPTSTATATETPVPPTQTPLPPTNTPTETETPTITPTPTISGPFIYTVQEGDTLSTISEQFGVDVIRIMEANELENEAIFIGQQLLIPDPNEPPPSATPLPEGLPPGFIIEYRVQPDDSLSGIAFLFNSTVEAILEANEDLEDENAIFVGQILLIPVNLVTPAPTNTPGEPAPVSTPGSIATLTPTP
ncbi:MAG TPA: LysM peptidoglycan-binding domain-containing protein [Anaerolineales bacterium]|nr:LysM peptidoglycan-binding domain-containing protein [Anaerolineales bacterium]